VRCGEFIVCFTLGHLWIGRLSALFQTKSFILSSLTIRANEGHLYPLEKQFIFIHKPAVLIRFDEVESVEFQRYAGGQGSTRNFDLCVSLHHTPGDASSVREYTFSGIDKTNYAALYSFLSGKNIRIKNIQGADEEQPSSGGTSRYEAMDGAEEGGESSEDDDYDQDNPSGSGESSGSDSEDDDDDLGSVASDDSDLMQHKKNAVAEKPNSSKKSKEKAVGKSSSDKKRKESAGAASTKKKKKKDPNAPKNAMSGEQCYHCQIHSGRSLTILQYCQHSCSSLMQSVTKSRRQTQMRPLEIL
jgi:structure-specific recognition protein 1